MNAVDCALTFKSLVDTANEGNFVAIVRLLAKNNAILKDHLVSGPKNVRYTSKTIQNEIMEVAVTV